VLSHKSARFVFGGVPALYHNSNERVSSFLILAHANLFI